MNIPYRTQRRIKRAGLIFLIVAMIGVIVWFCSVIFLERYIVYTREGAELNFDLKPQEVMGEIARPPVGNAEVSIYYNEGENALDTNATLTQLDGYYIDSETLNKDISSVWDMIKILPQGTPVMIELKAGYGSFYYKSTLTDAISAKSVSVDSVDELIKEMHKKGFYTIAEVSTLRDYCFGLNHVPAGLPIKGKQYLWMDPGGCYWLKPDNESVKAWIKAYVKELKEMGFDEIVLADFMYPKTDQVNIPENGNELLGTTAAELLEEFSEDGFTLSFGVADSTFPLPEGRTRIYLRDIDAQAVSQQLSQTTIPDPSIKMVFMAKTNDTRYEQGSVLRPISSAEVLEAQKASKEKKKKDLSVPKADNKEAKEPEGPAVATTPATTPAAADTTPAE